MRNSENQPTGHTVFRGNRLVGNFLVISGFSGAMVSEAATPVNKIQATFPRTRSAPPRFELNQPCDPQDTLNYRQLLAVYGSATNAFLNLTRSPGLETRQWLLLTPERRTMQVVAGVNLDDKWVVVDPSHRVTLPDPSGNLLTRHELQDPRIFEQATNLIPNYTKEYNYHNFAHVRVSALPFHGFQLRQRLDRYLPGWDESLDCSLLLGRSFFYRFLSVSSSVFLMLKRVVLAWRADHRFRISRSHFRENLARAKAAFFTPPEIK